MCRAGIRGKLTISLTSESPVFQLLVAVHNTIQRVQCFQCPPPALCTDARDLVQEVPTSLVTLHRQCLESGLSFI